MVAFVQPNFLFILFSQSFVSLVNIYTKQLLKKNTIPICNLKGKQNK